MCYELNKIPYSLYLERGKSSYLRLQNGTRTVSLLFLGNPESSSLPSVFQAWKWFKSELGNTGGGISNKNKREQHLKKLPPLTNTAHASEETEASSFAKIMTFSKRSRCHQPAICVCSWKYPDLLYYPEASEAASARCDSRGVQSLNSWVLL